MGELVMLRKQPAAETIKQPTLKDIVIDPSHPRAPTREKLMSIDKALVGRTRLPECLGFPAEVRIQKGVLDLENHRIHYACHVLFPLPVLGEDEAVEQDASVFYDLQTYAWDTEAEDIASQVVAHWMASLWYAHFRGP